MELLSEDDLNLKEMTRDELDRAWNLWFDLAQATNDFDPPYTHGCSSFARATRRRLRQPRNLLKDRAAAYPARPKTA